MPPSRKRIISEVVTPAMRDCSAQVEQSHVELQQLRAERDRMAEVQAEVMKLVGAPKPEKILHDLRNVLNELALLRPLVGNE